MSKKLENKEIEGKSQNKGGLFLIGFFLLLFLTGCSNNIKIDDFECNIDWRSCKELAIKYIDSKDEICQVQVYEYMNETNSYRYIPVKGE